MGSDPAGLAPGRTPRTWPGSASTMKNRSDRVLRSVPSAQIGRRRVQRPSRAARVVRACGHRPARETCDPYFRISLLRITSRKRTLQTSQ